MKKVGEIMKKLFPAPKMPQKRYCMIALLVIYYAFKIYVSQTESTLDDQLPDIVKAAMMDVLAENEDYSPIIASPEDQVKSA